MTDDIHVAQVMMPERGLFLVRCTPPIPPNGAQVLVTLDYGPDFGQLIESGVYDPGRHGARIPGFQLTRAREPGDEATLAENEKLAQAMRTTFLKSALAYAPNLRVPYVRLSFARTRLFLVFAADGQTRPDLSRSSAELRRIFGVEVKAWQMGPRDEVSMMGGLGPCGRACCCCTWQKRYPSHLNAERFRGENSSQLNGTCGRFKCCLAF